MLLFFKPKLSAIFLIAPILGSFKPFSHVETALSVTPTIKPKSFWDKLYISLNNFIFSDIPITKPLL